MLKVYYGDIRNLRPGWEQYPIGKARLERTLRYKKIADQARSVGAELLLYQAFQRVFPNFSPPAIFRTGEHGKPALADGNGALCFPSGKLAEFNLSHSGDYVACVIADRSVGIDIEAEKDAIRPGILRFLAKEERMDVENASCGAQRFFEYWVLKESYIKAVGTGFAKAPDSFCLLKCGDGYRAYENGQDQGYGFQLLAAPSGYKMAVCAEGDIWEAIEPEELVLDKFSGKER